MGKIKINRGFPPEIAEKLESIDEHELAELLGLASTRRRTSKWAKMIARIENDDTLKDPEFQVAWRKMKADMQDWRENFKFKSDEAQ